MLLEGNQFSNMGALTGVSGTQLFRVNLRETAPLPETVLLLTIDICYTPTVQLRVHVQYMMCRIHSGYTNI